jgi:hypothetical protein
MPGLLVTNYDLSNDDRVVATVVPADGTPQVWLASLDARQPPHRIGDLRGDTPRFVSEGDIVYRERDGNSHVLVRVHPDGTDRRRLGKLASTVLGTVSPDGEWVSASGVFDGVDQSLVLISVRGGGVRQVFTGALASRLRWSADGSRMYVSIQVGEASAFAIGRTYVIPLRRGEILPPMPAAGLHGEEQIAAIPGVQTIPYGDLAGGPLADVYAFSRTTITRNLYRIPLP